MMLCKEICKKYRQKKIAGKSWYESGVRCQICEIFISEKGTINGDKLRCICCGYRVRTKPRCKIYKDRLARN